MSYVKYENLGTPNMVLEKIRDYVVQEGYTIVENCVDDLDIFDRNYNDGKKLVFKDKTDNYFVCMRSMNGYQIFPEMQNGVNSPHLQTLPTNVSQRYVGIGMTVSEGYSATNRWYDQYLAPTKLNSNIVVGTGMRVAGESPSIKTMYGLLTKSKFYPDLPNPIPPNYVSDFIYDNTAKTLSGSPLPNTTKNLIDFRDISGNLAQYRAEKDSFSFDIDFIYDFGMGNNFVQDCYASYLSLIQAGKLQAGTEAVLYYPYTIKNKNSGKVYGTNDVGIRVRILPKKTPNNGYDYDLIVINLGSLDVLNYISNTYLPVLDIDVSTYLNQTGFPPTQKMYIDLPIANFSDCGTFPSSVVSVRFSTLNNQTMRAYYNKDGAGNLLNTHTSMIYKNDGTSAFSPNCEVVFNDIKSSVFHQGRIAYSNTSQQVTFLNPSTLYCNHITSPTDTLIFTLVDKDSGCYQHLIVGNLHKYTSWEGGIFMSGSYNSYTLSKNVYSNSTFDDYLPVLSTTGLGATTFARINIDEAPLRSKIYWASSGSPNQGDPAQCYTGKQLAMPIRFDDGKTGSWRPLIPHYGHLQSKSQTDAGVNSNTLNCITVNLPLFMAVKVDPDSLNNFAPIGEISGVYLVSLQNMASGKLYEISYPTSGNLHQVFSLNKRRGRYGFDGISINQEDNS